MNKSDEKIIMYEKPYIEIIKFETQDVILTSGGLMDGGIGGEIGEEGEHFGG